MMTAPLVVALLALPSLPLSGATDDPVTPRGVKTHKVIGITDGDTLQLLVDRQPLKLRLANIDAPEATQAFGERARQSLSDLCRHKQATYVKQDTDHYGRIVAVVFCDGINVNRAQVERGMAWVYSRYNKDTALPALQEQAKSARRGLWADPAPVSPWTFRRHR